MPLEVKEIKERDGVGHYILFQPMEGKRNVLLLRQLKDQDCDVQDLTAAYCHIKCENEDMRSLKEYIGEALALAEDKMVFSFISRNPGFVKIRDVKYN